MSFVYFVTMLLSWILCVWWLCYSRGFCVFGGYAPASLVGFVYLVVVLLSWVLCIWWLCYSPGFYWWLSYSPGFCVFGVYATLTGFVYLVAMLLSRVLCIWWLYYSRGFSTLAVDLKIWVVIIMQAQWRGHDGCGGGWEFDCRSGAGVGTGNRLTFDTKCRYSP